MNPKPFFVGYLPEDEGHQIYYEEYGNQNGQAIVVLHGGPGSRSKPKQAWLYDLETYHVILFDQRGCGKSLPQGETKNNNTSSLISDIERLRERLGIARWFVAGGSWGSTLALAYAESHPEKVRGLLLSSIFLARKQDVAWSFTQAGGIDKIFTDLWESRSKFLEEYGATPNNAAKVLLNIIENGTPDTVKAVVAGFMNWEGNLMSSQSDLTLINPEDVKEDNINEVKVFLHYEANDSFLNDNSILENIETIKNIPAIIVHGRYDLLCTLDQMWDLTKALPKSEYLILPSSNHRLTADGEIARKFAYKYFLSRNSQERQSI